MPQNIRPFQFYQNLTKTTVAENLYGIPLLCIPVQHSPKIQQDDPLRLPQISNQMSTKMIKKIVFPKNRTFVKTNDDQLLVQSLLRAIL